MNRLDIRGRVLVRNWLLILSGHVVPLLIGLISVPVVVRGLGTERFGLLALTWTLLGALSVFDLGLGRAVTKFVAEALGRGDPGRIPGIIWPAVAGQAIFGTVGGVLLAAAASPLAVGFLNVSPPMQAEAIQAFRILALSLPVVLISFSFAGALEAAQRFGVLSAIRVVSSSSTFLAPLAGVFLRWDLPGILAALLVVRLLVLGAQSLACLRVLPMRMTPGVSARTDLRPLFVFGGWITLSGLTGLVLAPADRFVIGNLLTMTAVTYYAVSRELLSRLDVMTATVAVVLFPAFSTLGGAGDRARLERLFRRSTKYVLLAVAPVYGLVAVFALEILTLWLGAPLAEQSAPVLRILAVGAALQLVTLAPYVLLQGLGRSDLTAKFHLLETPVYLLGMWWFVRLYGIQGAAYAWSGRMVLDAVLLLGAARRLEVWTWQRAGGAFRRVVLPVLAFCVLSAVSHALPVPLPLRVGLVGGLLALFGWWVWTRSLEPDERRWMSRFVSGWRAEPAGIR